MEPLTASIVVHKTPREQLDKVLGCLLRSPVEKIYVVDNSPSDELREVVDADPRVDYRHVENEGFGKGHNLAMREVLKDDREGYHLVLNADIWWEGEVIERLLEYMSSHPEVGMVMPKVFYPDGDLQYACRMLPTPIDLFAKRFLPASLTKKRMERYLLADHNHDEPLDCPYLLGSFLLFRKAALKESGLFDERYFMYPEDIDITRRIHRNHKTMYWPEVSIIHEHQAASRKNLRMLRIHLANMVKYFNKWGWFFDSERKSFNRRLRQEMAYQPEAERPCGRG